MTDLRSHGAPPEDNVAESEQSPEKREELGIMKVRIENALKNPEIKTRVFSDFTYTFQQLGLSAEQADKLTGEITDRLLELADLNRLEQEILQQFQNIKIGELNLTEVLDDKLKGRAELIVSQVKNYLTGIQGKVFDYGAGDGQVTQRLHDELGLDIEGADVRPYVAKSVIVPIRVFDGRHVEAPDKYYEAAIMTNVAHHEKNNEVILQELDRIVAKKLVVLETVPVGANDQEIAIDAERTFMNDYLYNRLFHNADIPVPGTYETPQGWVNRFSKYGWQLKHSENLGFDQPTIKDVHHLLVFER